MFSDLCILKSLRSKLSTLDIGFTEGVDVNLDELALQDFVDKADTVSDIRKLRANAKLLTSEVIGGRDKKGKKFTKRKFEKREILSDSSGTDDSGPETSNLDQLQDVLLSDNAA